MRANPEALDRRVCVIMPAYNEEGFIRQVIEQVGYHAPFADIVVVDDGSVDQTRRLAEASGALVLSLPFNLGIGGAVQTGLKYAYRNGYDIAVEVDADGQHDPAYIPQLVDALVVGRGDMVIGSRFVTRTAYHSSPLRLFGIHLFSHLIKLVTGTRIYDSTSGYRAYNKRALKFLSQRYPADFPEPESIVMLLNAGFRIEEFSTEMQTRQAGQSVVGTSDVSLRAAYFVMSNAIAILVSGLKRKHTHVA